MGKRTFDLIFSICALILTSPVLIGAAVWIKLDSEGPIIFRHLRVGQRGVLFNVFKLRTMYAGRTDNGLSLTSTSDARITRSGKFLRRAKIDELPQFVNVLMGNMSVVGPRPEVKKYVDLYPPHLREKILSVRPGITDNAAIAFRGESNLLAASDDPEKEYIESILPAKLALYEKYVNEQSLAGDIVLIARTVTTVIGH